MGQIHQPLIDGQIASKMLFYQHTAVIYIENKINLAFLAVFQRFQPFKLHPITPFLC